MRKSIRLFFISAALVLLVLLALRLGMQTEAATDGTLPVFKSSVNSGATTEFRTADPRTTNAVTASKPSQLKPRLEKRDSELARSFATSGDLKKFVDFAKSNPEHASYFYGLRALKECDELISALNSAEVAAGSEHDPRRATLIQTSKARCRNLSAEETSGAARRKMATEGVEAKDTGLEVVREPTNTDLPQYDPREVRARSDKKVSAIFESQDVGVIELAVRDLMSSSDGISINGRQLTEIERSSLPAALLLLTCELGAPCDQSNFFIRRECLALGRCDFSNVADYAQRADPQSWQMFTSGSRYSFQAAVELKEEIAAGVSQGDRKTITLKVKNLN